MKRTILLLLLALAVSAPRGAETDLALQVTAGAGVDSNPLHVSGDEKAGSFTDLRLDARYRGDWNRRAGFFLGARAHNRLHESATSDGDFGLLNLESGLNFAPLRQANTHLLFSTGVRYDRYRTTYVDRETGLPYEVVTDPGATPPTTVTIPDRLDSDAAGAFLNIHWKLNRRLRLSLETALDDVGYVEDYQAVPGIDSLDHERLSLEPGIHVVVHRQARLNLSYHHSRLDYDNRLSRDISGDPVSGTETSYRYNSWEVSMDVLPANKWRTGFGVMTTDRQDEYAGYYDYSSEAAFAFVEHSPTQKMQWQLHASLRNLDYNLATVDIDPASDHRGSDVLQTVGRFDRDLTPALTLFVEAGLQDADNPDPVLAFSRNWTQVGVRARLFPR